MRSWSRLRRFVSRALAPERAERELDEELQAYVELLSSEKAAQGLSPEQARRAALLEVGGVEQVKEEVRGARFGSWLEDAARDLRHGARLLARTPGFTLAAVAALALGIGAATVIFSAVDAVLLKPLPYVDPERLVVVLHEGRHPVAPSTFEALRRDGRSFDAVGVAEFWRPNLASAGAAETVLGLRLTASTMELTGGRPLLGRLLRSEDEEEDVVLLSHGLWQRQFAGDSEILGRSVRLDGIPRVVIGVMPPGFDFPPFWARGAELWAPLPLRERRESDGRSLRLFARLAPETSLAEARSELATLVARAERERPGEMRGLAVVPLADMVVRNVRPALWALLGAVGLLLLIACANVAHMLLARAAGRAREMALRHALGAGRTRVLRQLLTESALLAGLGSAAGIGLAFIGARLLVAWRPASVPRIETLSLDLRVLAVAVAASLACGLAFGLAPALQAVRRDLVGGLRQGERGSSEDPGRRRVRSALVASEVALALVLLVGAGLLIRTFAALQAIDPGFDPKGVLTMVVSLSGSERSAPGRRAAFFQEALERLRALPGVEAASAINHLPMGGDLWGLGFHVRGRPLPAPGERPAAAYRVVMPGYFDAMRLALVRGRDFDEHDVLGRPGVIVVNEAMARSQWSGEDPLGSAMTLGDPADPDAEWLSVVGVAEDAVRDEWAAEPAPEIYLPYLQSRSYLEEAGGHLEYLSFVLRTGGDVTALAPAARGAVHSLARDAAIADLHPMEELVAQGLAEPRLYLILLASFAAVALALAAVGIYGVVSHGVSRRRQELAIRMALGARSGELLRLVLRQGMATVSVGLGAGLVGALALGTTLRSLLYGVEPGDPLTLAAVVATLGAVALAATYVPARRAVALRALEELRHE
jgi:putative ABC transport system permease protein